MAVPFSTVLSRILHRDRTADEDEMRHTVQEPVARGARRAQRTTKNSEQTRGPCAEGERHATLCRRRTLISKALSPRRR